MWRSLRLRILLATAAVVLISVSVTAFVASQRTTGEFRRYVEHDDFLRDRRLVYFLARSYIQNRGWEAVQDEVQQMAELSGQRMVVADAFGRVVADSEESLIGKMASPAWRRAVAPIVIDDVRIGSLYIDPVTDDDRAAAGFLAAVNRSLTYGAVIAALAAVVATLAISGRILRPVARLTAAAQRMEKGDLSVQVPVESEDEIGKLAHAFNAMAGSLAQQEQLRRNMVGDVAHELRTPLTNLRGYLQATRDGLLPPDMALVDNLYEETMLLSRLVADLQELAQAEAGQLTLMREPTPIKGIAEQAASVLQPQASAKDIDVKVDLQPDLPPVDVDRERIGQVLRNLLNNAIAHTPQGGTITIAADCVDDRVRISVSDTGTGIAPEHLPHVFDRFYRADKSRARQTGGAGLGLAIVKQLVSAHGGTVSVQSALGRGSTFTVSLPVSSTN